jgi:hypothetical protein
MLLFTRVLGAGERLGHRSRRMVELRQRGFQPSGARGERVGMMRLRSVEEALGDLTARR